MRRDRRRPSLMLLLVIALLALLPLLAVLQYRWLGEVSVGERERMQDNLRKSAAKFTEEFDHELTNIFIRFQTSSLRSQPMIFSPTAQSLALKNAPEDGIPNPVEMYRHWLTTTKHPQIIDEIYQARIAASGQPELLRLNMTT